MSNIYISEPATNGKVVMNTSCGEIEIELWPKETPLACRNFVQLCLEGYYNNTIFHRLLKNFIIQGGDPTGTGDGGDSIYNGPFKTEIHSRLRFNRRGLVAMHSVDDQVLGSQFFFTLDSAQELQNNYTIFGTVVGKTLYNMINLAEGEVDKQTKRPLLPKKIISTHVIVNPFDDIVPRVKPSVASEIETEKEDRMRNITKDRNLLSFGDDEEDEEEQIESRNQFRAKSAHDYAKNSNLSKESVIVDSSEEICVADSNALVPLETSLQQTDDDASIERCAQLREESLRLQMEIVSERMKKGNEEASDENVHLERMEMRSMKMIKNRINNPMAKLSEFAKKIKSSVPGDWYYSTITAGDNDELETKVRDPDTFNPDKYDLNDPRNPLNQRKRQGDEPVTKKRKD